MVPQPGLEPGTLAFSDLSRLLNDEPPGPIVTHIAPYLGPLPHRKVGEKWKPKASPMC